MKTYETLEDLDEGPLATITSETIKTGSWRTFRPVIDHGKCTKCNVCWKYCPDVAIRLNADGFPVVNLDACKGCGICAEECSPKAIAMAEEE